MIHSRTPTHHQQPQTAVEHAPDEDEETRRSAVEDLALLLLQRGESQEADTLLSGLGFTHRLATAVLVCTYVVWHGIDRSRVS